MDARGIRRFLDAGSTEMHYAIVEDDLKKLAYLIKNHRRLLNVRDKNGRAPIHIAALTENQDAYDLLFSALADSIYSEEDSDETNAFAKFAWFAVKTVAVSGLILGGTAVILPALGFGAAGVTAGSLASLYQSRALGGYIAKRSLFALLQSAGAAGLAASTKAAVVGGSAVAVKVHEHMADSKKKK